MPVWGSLCSSPAFLFSLAAIRPRHAPCRWHFLGAAAEPVSSSLSPMDAVGGLRVELEDVAPAQRWWVWVGAAAVGCFALQRL